MIGVIGDSSIDNDQERKIAYEVGYLIAKNNFVLVCGGRAGVMEEACRGALDAGGLTVAILPSSTKEEANPYCNIVIPTGLGWTRNSLVALSSDILICIGGKSGTLSEIAFGWMYNKPIIAFSKESGINGWSAKVAGKKIDDRRNDSIYSVKTAEEAINIAKKFINQKTI